MVQLQEEISRKRDIFKTLSHYLYIIPSQISTKLLHPSQTGWKSDMTSKESHEDQNKGE